MAHVSLSPKFIKDSISVFKQRGLKGLLFGVKAEIDAQESALVQSLAREYDQHQKQGAKKGKLVKVDLIHKGEGRVYLIPNNKNTGRSWLVFDADTKIVNGPDLWVYLSDSKDPRQSLGNYSNLGLLKGNKGAQVYSVDKSFEDLSNIQTAIIYCKQFEVLFTYALLK